MTAMAKAMRDAGIRSAQEDLDAKIREICYSKEWEYDYLMRRAIWGHIKNRSDFLAIIIGEKMDNMLRLYMDGMHPPVELQKRKTPPRLEDEPPFYNQMARQRAIRLERTAGNEDIWNSRRKHMVDTIVSEYKQSILFKFVINGKPIGEVMAKEALGWADSHRQKSDFISIMLSGISLSDNRMIKEIVSPREANKQWTASGGRPFP